MDTEQYERSDYFFIELAPPIWAKKMSDLSKVQERFQRRMEQKRRASIASESKESSEPGRTRTPSRDFLTTDPNQRAVSASPNLNSRFKKRMGSWIAGMKGADDAMAGLTADQLEIAELGKPRLGEYAKCQITIKESKEFQKPEKSAVATHQVSILANPCQSLQGIVDRMIKNANTKLMLGTSSWREQFIDALTVNAGRTRTPSRDFLTTDPNQRAVSASPNLNSRFKKRMGSWIAGMKGADDAMAGLTADQLEIAELGKPRLGEYAKCQITIKESKEFQ
ncbi:hypothetical protein ANCDUO_13415, partial [Ancylostoma duodenale]